MKRTQSAVAFLPWVRVDEIHRVGGLRLIPYKRGLLPGDMQGVRQRELDAVLSAYADRPRKRVERATLLEVGSWKSGQDASRALPKLFRARDFLCTSALAARKLFHGHSGYCNAHHYELVVQAFNAGQAKSVAFTTRRRDGSSTVLWGANEFAFHRPLHVTSDQRAEFDASLLRALMQIPVSEGWIHEAIVEFNAANTDSSDVPRHVEVVLMKSAFDWLLQIDYRAKNFIKAIVRHLVPPGSTPPTGPLTARWLARPRKGGVLEAWAEEFCNLRNLSAHGGDRGPNFVWSREAHLVFAATVFPLLLKKILADRQWYALTDRDKLGISLLDRFVAFDPLKATSRGHGTHPWLKISSDAQLRAALERAWAERAGESASVGARVSDLEF